MRAIRAMFTPKFITDEQISAKSVGQTIELDDAEAKHAGVLRVKCGDLARIYSLPANLWFEGTIAANSKQTFAIRIENELNISAADFSKLRLFIGTPATSTLETIVQHTTEIGVASIVLFRAERTQFKLDQAAEEKIIQRLKKIAIAALKQSGTTRLPQIAFDRRSISEIVRDSNPQSVFLGSLSTDSDLVEIFLKNPRFFNEFEQISKTDDLISVVIGPEGGLTETEESSLVGLGVTPFSLGAAALRVETACIVTTGIFNSFIRTGKQKNEVSQLQATDL